MSQVRNMAWTITTVDGATHTHIYAVPSDPSERQELINESIDRIVGAVNGKYPSLNMDNPFAVYNPTHIVRIAFDSYDDEQLKTLYEQAQRRIGFPKPPESN